MPRSFCSYGGLDPDFAVWADAQQYSAHYWVVTVNIGEVIYRSRDFYRETCKGCPVSIV